MPNPPRPLLGPAWWRLSAFSMTQSMSRAGDCWDNASPSSFATLRAEFVDHELRHGAGGPPLIRDYIEGFYSTEVALVARLPQSHRCPSAQRTSTSKRVLVPETRPSARARARNSSTSFLALPQPRRGRGPSSGRRRRPVCPPHRPPRRDARPTRVRLPPRERQHRGARALSACPEGGSSRHERSRPRETRLRVLSITERTYLARSVWVSRHRAGARGLRARLCSRSEKGTSRERVSTAPPRGGQRSAERLSEVRPGDVPSPEPRLGARRSRAAPASSSRERRSKWSGARPRSARRRTTRIRGLPAEDREVQERLERRHLLTAPPRTPRRPARGALRVGLKRCLEAHHPSRRPLERIVRRQPSRDADALDSEARLCSRAMSSGTFSRAGSRAHRRRLHGGIVGLGGVMRPTEVSRGRAFRAPPHRSSEHGAGAPHATHCGDAQRASRGAARRRSGRARRGAGRWGTRRGRPSPGRLRRARTRA